MSAYDMVNKIIIKKLMDGVVPWQKLWRSKQGLPAMSLQAGVPYNGVNQILLGCLAEEFRESPYFLTYRQAVERGGNVKKGEKGFHIIFFKKLEDAEEHEIDEEDRKYKFVVRYYTVFNLEQCENIKLTEKEKAIIDHSVEIYENPIIQKAEDVIKCYSKLPTVQIKESFNPSYNNSLDLIKMPPIKQFESSEEYYASYYHEIIHSTGHKSRLNRFRDKMTIRDRVQEELIGEIGSAYLSLDAGILDKVVDNNAAYVNYWIDKISINKRLFVSATSKAEKAHTFIINNVVKSVRHSRTA